MITRGVEEKSRPIITTGAEMLERVGVFGNGDALISKRKTCTHDFLYSIRGKTRFCILCGLRQTFIGKWVDSGKVHITEVSI